MRIIFSLTLLAVSFQVLHAQDTELTQLVKKKRYTEVQKRLEEGNISKENKDIYLGLLLSVFGQADTANTLISKALNNTTLKDDSLRHMLLEAEHSNYVRQFNYQKAYETKKYLLDNYASFVENKNLFDEHQVKNIWETIKDVPPQRVKIAGDVSVPVKRDQVGLQRFPVKKDNKTYSFIFDTGAGISTTTDSMAAVLGLSIYDKIPVVIKGGITGLGTNVKLGIADKLYIGDIEISNVLFLVFPDSSLTFKISSVQTYKVDVVIGFPVIKELGIITFEKDQLSITTRDDNPYQQNMAIEYLKPILYLEYNGEDLPFTFDTGAGETVFTEVFYNRYKSMVDKRGKKATERYGGAGGAREFAVMVVPSIRFRCMSDEVIIKGAKISTETIHTGDDVFYGNLGQDLVKQFKSMTINFRRSWIKFNK